MLAIGWGSVPYIAIVILDIILKFTQNLHYNDISAEFENGSGPTESMATLGLGRLLTRFSEGKNWLLDWRMSAGW
ncbi:hypothetical protein DPMN_178218 [Dreissena polymorpha]|uniref:Uncharacterized protein n=1 Tax=Dreissena polymorpha TaxID=45954 RepID=A0A9D4ECF1_DREPO|nr:hypothetical protein DPMN_178218 [Dreissena polymorpha]